MAKRLAGTTSKGDVHHHDRYFMSLSDVKPHPKRCTLFDRPQEKAPDAATSEAKGSK